jgi:hypothetical protein
LIPVPGCYLARSRNKAGNRMGHNHETSPKGDWENEFNGYRELLARV